MGALPKTFKPKKHHRYVAWLHTQPCIVTGERVIEAHHLRNASQSKDDRYCVPLAPHMHRNGEQAVHVIGWDNFECIHGLDLYAEAERHWAKWQRSLQAAA